jgi:hypothetical protein
MISVVLGRRGSGKSVLALSLFERARRSERCPAVIVDTLMEYQGYMLSRPDQLEEWIGESVSWASDLHRTQSALKVRVDCRDPDDLRTVVDALRSWTAPDPVKRAGLLLIDECSYWSKPQWTSPALSALVRYGRHWILHLIAVGRRPAEISRELTSQADRFYIFRMTEPVDLEWIAKILEPADVERIKTLGRYRFMRVPMNDREGKPTIDGPITPIVS